MRLVLGVQLLTMWSVYGSTPAAGNKNSTHTQVTTEKHVGTLSPDTMPAKVTGNSSTVNPTKMATKNSQSAVTPKLQTSHPHPTSGIATKDFNMTTHAKPKTPQRTSGTKTRHPTKTTTHSNTKHSHQRTTVMTGTQQPIPYRHCGPKKVKKWVKAKDFQSEKKVELTVCEGHCMSNIQITDDYEYHLLGYCCMHDQKSMVKQTIELNHLWLDEKANFTIMTFQKCVCFPHTYENLDIFKPKRKTVMTNKQKNIWEYFLYLRNRLGGRVRNARRRYGMSGNRRGDRRAKRRGNRINTSQSTKPRDVYPFDMDEDEADLDDNDVDYQQDYD